MIELEIGKAIVAVETGTVSPCRDCCFQEFTFGKCEINCTSGRRKDGKNVVYKLVDYPPQTELCTDKKYKEVIDCVMKKCDYLWEEYRTNTALYIKRSCEELLGLLGIPLPDVDGDVRHGSKTTDWR